MTDELLESKICALGDIVNEVHTPLQFTILEIGAVPLEGQSEPFHQLLDVYPGSEIIAFEIDDLLCDELNENAKKGLKYYPVALGCAEETRTFYETMHPMCCSLYKPNEELISLYNHMEVAMLKSVSEINTVSLDNFVSNHQVESVDFIKIDIQGAELDVFRGGVNTLKDVVAIVCEVEFIQHYIDQPLFGDVCQFLADNNIMFHKFLGMAGRTLKPVFLHNNPVYPSQHIWTDAAYIRNIQKLSDLRPEKLLKLGVLAFMYGSTDVTFHCFRIFDERNATNISQRLLELAVNAGKL